jgi:hypothetical protein
MQRRRSRPGISDELAPREEQQAREASSQSLHRVRNGVRLLVPIALMSAAACARANLSSRDIIAFDTQPVSSGAPEVTTGSQSSTKHLGRADLASVQGSTVAEAVLQLRPEWLRPNPSPGVPQEDQRASVYIDGTRAGGTDELRLVPLAPTIDLQFFSPSAAWDRFGPLCRCPSGVILVVTRPSRSW